MTGGALGSTSRGPILPLYAPETGLHQMPSLHQKRPKKQAGEAGGLAQKSGKANDQ